MSCLRAGFAVDLLIVGFAACVSTGPGGPGPNTNGSVDNENAPEDGSNGACTGNEHCDVGQICDGEVCIASPEPAWQVVHNNLPSSLLSVQAVSNGDVYAVGFDTGDGNGPYVLRYDGTAWRCLFTGLAEGDLTWLHEVEPDEIWMCGEDRLTVRYTPSTDTFTPIQAGEGDERLFGIWGSSANDIWTVGGTITRGNISRFDGDQWRDVDIATVGDGSILPRLFKVWGTGPDDVWIVGNGGRIIHYENGEYTVFQTETKQSLFAVQGLADGSMVSVVGGFQTGEIYDRIDGAYLVVTPPNALQMNGLNFWSDGTALAVGINASTLRRGETGWSAEENGLVDMADRDFHAVWAVADGGAWAVGGNITVPPYDRGMVAYYGTTQPSSAFVE